MKTFRPKTQFAIAVLASSVSLAAQSQLVLEEIVVTAQKRAESLQDVPISVSALQGDRIQEAGIADMQAMADYVPNLYIAKASANTNVYMRGIGSSNNQGFEQSVGMYLDGVYLGRGRQYRAGFFDVERVEVLRGPQGTLFGKNTIAGAVSLISASPVIGDEVSGQLAVSVESNDGRVIEGHLQGSLSDTFAARLAVKSRKTDGHVENTLLGRDEGEIDDLAVRLSLAWEPTDSLSVSFKHSDVQFEKKGTPSATFNYLDAAGRAQYPNMSAFALIAYNLTDAFFPAIFEETTKEYTVYKDGGAGVGLFSEMNDDEYNNTVLRLDWDFGEHTFTSITGYSEYSFDEGEDTDRLPIQFIDRDASQDFEQLSQEFRITSPGGEFFDYIAGVYVESGEMTDHRRITMDASVGGFTGMALPVDSLITLLTGGAYNANQIARNRIYELDTDSWAIFGQGTFNLTDTLRLTIGLRYTEEDKDVRHDQILSDDISGLGEVITDPFQSFMAGTVWATAFNTYAFNYAESRKTDKWLPSLNLQWDVGDNSMLYASFSQGFKSGGFTAAQDGEPGDLTPGAWPCNPAEPLTSCYDFTRPNADFEFDDEEADAFEIGGKHTLLDGAMTLNWAAFYTEYDNLQVSIFKGIGFTVTNAASSTVTGLEVDMLWQATENLLLGADFALLNAEYDEYRDAPCTALQLDADPLCGTSLGVSNNDLSGEPTTYAPDYSASLRMDYTRPVGTNGMEFFLGMDVNLQDEKHSAGDNDSLDKLDSYAKMNARTGLRSDNWEIMLYGRNVFDEHTLDQSFDVPVLTGSHGGFISEGRVVGAKLSYRF